MGRLAVLLGLLAATAVLSLFLGLFAASVVSGKTRSSPQAPVAVQRKEARLYSRTRARSVGVASATTKSCGSANKSCILHPQRRPRATARDSVASLKLARGDPAPATIQTILPAQAQGGYADLLNRPCFEASLNCRWHPGPSQPQCCCRVPDANRLKLSTFTLTCLPSFFIIGAQKAGSTALMGYFLDHPNFKPPYKKEGHYFDRNLEDAETKKTSLERYMKIFRRVNQGVDTSSFLTGDATPAYALSPKNAARLHSSFPQARLVMIVRNPVDRAYSEYNMKVRRVERQFDPNDRKMLALAHNAIRPCYGIGRDVKEVFGAPASAPNNIKPGGPGDNLSDVQKCVMSRLASVPGFKALARKSVHGARVAKCFPAEQKDFPEEKEIAPCFGEKVVRREKVAPLEQIFSDEMAHVRKCMARARPHETHLPMPPGNDSIVDPDGYYFRWATPGCWVNGSSSNIVADYVPRSIYLPQIKSWLEYFSREQLLIISDSDLRKDPGGTMARVFEHVGLPAHDVSHLTPAMLETKLSRAWPKFEESTGWQFSSRYDPMPAYLWDELNQFFKPHNRRLYNFLGRSFDWPA